SKHGRNLEITQFMLFLAKKRLLSMDYKISSTRGKENMNLYELTGAYLQIQNMIEEGAEGLEDTLESLNDAIEDKAEGYGKIIRNLEAQANALREEEKRLADRRRSI